MTQITKKGQKIANRTCSRAFAKTILGLRILNKKMAPWGNSCLAGAPSPVYPHGRQPRAASTHPMIGFTLVEIVLTLIILAILASIAMPNFGGAQDQLELDEIESQLISDLRSLRQEAMGCGGGSTSFSVNENGWEREGCNGNNSTTRNSFGESFSISITPDGSSFSFTYPYGRLDPDDNYCINLKKNGAKTHIRVGAEAGHILKDDDCD